MKTSPTQRSLKLCRERGGIVAVVERWNQYARIRQDMFGFVDLVHINGNDVRFIQTTSGNNVAARIAKIQETPAFLYLHARSANIQVWVHGWRKIGAAGKRKLWEVREVQIL